MTYAAEAVTLAWDPNPPEEQVTGYIVYWGDLSRNDPNWTSYSQERDVGSETQTTIEIQGPGPYFFAAIAYNALGLHSDYSDELSIPGLTCPTGLHIQ